MNVANAMEVIVRNTTMEIQECERADVRAQCRESQGVVVVDPESTCGSRLREKEQDDGKARNGEDRCPGQAERWANGANNSGPRENPSVPPVI